MLNELNRNKVNNNKYIARIRSEKKNITKYGWKKNAVRVLTEYILKKNVKLQFPNAINI